MIKKREAEGKDKPACDEERFLQPRRELWCKNLRKTTSSISFTILVLYIPRFLASSSHMLSCPGSLSLLRVEASSISHSSAVSTETCAHTRMCMEFSKSYWEAWDFCSASTRRFKKKRREQGTLDMVRAEIAN